MRQFHIFGALVLATAVLGACTSTAGWTKATAEDEQVRTDLAACRGFARTTTDRDARIDRDIAAGRDAGPLAGARTLRRDVRAIGLERQFDRLVADCMRSRGYARDDAGGPGAGAGGGSS